MGTLGHNSLFRGRLLRAFEANLKFGLRELLLALAHATARLNNLATPIIVA
jgi:hypothetical protein